MKKNMIRFSVLVITALLFSTCAAFIDSPTGSITFAFPSGVLSRGIGDETYEVAIYYGLDRYEAAPVVSGDELSFADLPTGDVRIIVARGTADDDGFFYSKAYGQLFITIVTGDNGPYDLDLNPSDFVWVDSLQGADVNGLATLPELDGTFYTSTVSTLVKGTYSDGIFSDVAVGPEVPAGIAVNSISIGQVYEVGDPVPQPQVWVNGTWNESAGGGIMPWVDGALEPDLEFSAGFGNPENRQDGSVADLSVGYSGAFKVPDKDGLAIVFQRDGGMGGIYLDADEFYDLGTYPAYNRSWIVDDINFEELLADVVEEGTDFVKDLIVSSESSAAYIVTSIATLKVSEEVISDESDFGVDDIFSSDAVAFAPDLGSAIVSIDVSGSEADEVIYLGTENGLYSGRSSAITDEFFEGEGTLIDGTSGYYIKLVSASPAGDMVAFAASRGGNELLIIVDIDTDEVVDLRDLQGLPGNRLHNLVWLGNATLAVSGDHGLAVIETASIF